MMIEPNKYYYDATRNENVWAIGKIETSAEDEVWVVGRNDATLVLTCAKDLEEKR